jgi:hypothetical protein
VILAVHAYYWLAPSVPAINRHDSLLIQSVVRGPYVLDQATDDTDYSQSELPQSMEENIMTRILYTGYDMAFKLRFPHFIVNNSGVSVCIDSTITSNLFSLGYVKIAIIMQYNSVILCLQCTISRNILK